MARYVRQLLAPVAPATYLAVLANSRPFLVFSSNLSNFISNPINLKIIPKNPKKPPFFFYPKKRPSFFSPILGLLDLS